MDGYSRPATLDDLKTLLRALNQHGVDYLLIGGYALAAHGYQRATTDIDVMVPATTQAGRRVRDALMVLPDQAAKEIQPEWFEEGENIRVADAFVVDIMLNSNGLTYDTLRQYATTVDLDGIAVQTVDLQGLLLTKQTLCEKASARWKRFGISFDPVAMIEINPMSPRTDRDRARPGCDRPRS